MFWNLLIATGRIEKNIPVDTHMYYLGTGNENNGEIALFEEKVSIQGLWQSGEISEKTAKEETLHAMYDESADGEVNLLREK